jgi:hypothetical protein
MMEENALRSRRLRDRSIRYNKKTDGPDAAAVAGGGKLVPAAAPAAAVAVVCECV